MNRYNNLNGFRAFCAIGIALMHILANISPTPHLHNITPVIEWFTNFVFLFFIISSFSLCCGYYERIKTGSITLNCFYTKRYWRILPFFAFLSLIDIGEFYQFNLSSCIRQQNSLTAQFVSFILANLANIFYPPPIFTIINLCLL